MDKNLLGRAVEHHGPDFLRQLQLEQEQIPANIFLFLQKHRPQVPEISDPQFILNVRRFVSRKADVLFKANDVRDISIRNPNENEDCYARMPPLETFMGIDQYSCKKHLFLSLEIQDIVIGEVTSIMDSGLVLQLLCLEGKNRDINDLHIPAFIPSKEIPKLFPTQNPVEGYQIKDYVRGIVLSVNPDTENIIISLMDRTVGESSGPKPLLGLIQEEDFPVEYRRKLHIRGLTFDELVNSILGFSNPGNVSYLLDNLLQKHDSSLMRGLHNLKIPEKEYADILKKQQSQKWAYHCVAQGINFFKEGKQIEAMQQLNKALQIDKTNVEALVARGALYANNESYSRALTDFEDALTINPKHPNAIKYAHETLLAQGKCHEDEKNYSLAKRCYQRALEVIPLSQEAKESLRYVQYREESDGSKEKLILKSQSPHNETIEQLPVIQIDEDKQSTRKKGRSFERDSSDERKARNKSRSPLQHKQLSDSLSGSDLRNASRSRKGQFEVVRGQRSQSPIEIMDQSSYRSISREKEIHGKLKQRLTSSPHLQRDHSSSHELSVDKYQRESNLGRDNWLSQSYTSISIKKGDKISGLGTESRTGQWMSDPKAMDYEIGKHPQKKEQDIVVRDKDREAHTEREQYHEYGKGDRKREGPFHQQEGYSSSRQWETVENQFIKRPELQSFRKETSITPTRDEVNDRLGLEDISSPEDHNLRHGFRLRAYCSHEDDYKHRQFEKGDEKHKLHDHSMEKKAEEYDRYGKRYKRERSQSSKDRALTSYHSNSHGRKNSKERNSPPEYHERMIISVSRKGMSSVKELESDLDEIKKHNKREFSPQIILKTETEGHRSKEIQYDSNSKQDRSIVISKKERIDVKDTRELSKMESLTHYSTRSHRDSRSRSPEYKYVKTEKNDRSLDEEYSRSYSKDKQKSKQREIKAEGYVSYSKEIQRSPDFNRNKDETYGRSSRSPNYKKIKDEKRTWSTEGDTYQRVVALKPKSTASLDKTLLNQVIEDHLETDPHLRSEQSSKIDIFSDRQDPTVSNDSQVKFSTYIPRSVKLKLQHPEKGINPENRSVETKSVLNVPKLDMEVRSSKIIEIYDTKPTEDLKNFNMFNKTETEPRLSHQAKSPGKKYHSSKHVSRSRSRSYHKYIKKFDSSKDHKSRHNKKSRSRSISRSHDSYRKKGYKSRNKSRSRSHDKYNKSHKSRSRSKSHDRHSSSQKEKRISRFSNASDSKNLEARSQANVTKVDIPKISSRWDSPEEKKSRWTIAEDNKVIVSAEAILKAQQRIAAMLGASLISKSPPPHRRMKPEEKVALQKKWKELSVSPTDIPEDEVAPLQHILKQKAIEVEAKLVTEELVKKEISITDFRASGGKKSGHKNIKKMLKLKGSLRSKWESESESENESGPKSKSRSRSRSKDKSSKSTGQCSNTRGGSHSREGRSSSKKVLEKNNRSKSRERSGDKHHNKNSHNDYSRKFDKMSKIESGTDLPDVPNVKKAEKEEHRMFWLPKEQETHDMLRGFTDSSKSPRGLSRKKSYSRSRSKSRTPLESSLGKEPTSGKEARKPEDHLKLYKKSKWSSDTDSSDNDVRKKTEKKRESLNELEDFLNKLKSEKKRKMSGDEKLK